MPAVDPANDGESDIVMDPIIIYPHLKRLFYVSLAAFILFLAGMYLILHPTSIILRTLNYPFIVFLIGMIIVIISLGSGLYSAYLYIRNEPILVIYENGIYSYQAGLVAWDMIRGAEVDIFYVDHFINRWITKEKSIKIKYLAIIVNDNYEHKLTSGRRLLYRIDRITSGKKAIFIPQDIIPIPIEQIIPKIELYLKHYNENK